MKSNILEVIVLLIASIFVCCPSLMEIVFLIVKAIFAVVFPFSKKKSSQRDNYAHSSPFLIISYTEAFLLFFFFFFMNRTIY